MNEVYKLLNFKRIQSLMWDIIKLSNYTIGSPNSVEFDWEYVMNQEEKHGNIVGFFHTHPFCSSDIVQYSGIDYDTMCGWVDCFGKALYCIIGRGEEDVNPTVHVFAPKRKIVLCKGSVLGCDFSQECEWKIEDRYYKGIFTYDKSLYLKGNVLRLPHLCCI